MQRKRRSKETRSFQVSFMKILISIQCLWVSIIDTETINSIITNKDNRDGFDNPLTDNIHEISPITEIPIGLLNA